MHRECALKTRTRHGHAHTHHVHIQLLATPSITVVVAIQTIGLSVDCGAVKAKQARPIVIVAARDDPRALTKHRTMSLGEVAGVLGLGFKEGLTKKVLMPVHVVLVSKQKFSVAQTCCWRHLGSGSQDNKQIFC